MNLWADVYDATNTTRQGEGPVSLRSANIKRVLDGPGVINVTAAGWEKRAIDLIQPKRVLRIYTDKDNQKRLVGTMVVDDIKRGDGSSKTFTVSGKDLLSLLRNTNTGLGRAYDDQSLTAITTSLTGLAGWTVSAEAALSSVTTSARFDGSSVLRAIQAILDDKGAHLRLSADTADEIDIGYFGNDNGLRAENPSVLHRDAYDNDSLLLIDSIRETSKSSDIVNAILPLGAGDGDAALTIEKSTRGRATTKTGGDGRTEYWLEDATSISTYGRIERRVDFKKIAPITNSSSDVENASNALDDAAWTWLNRRTSPRMDYTLSCRKIPTTIQPGDKLTVNYKGRITNLAGDTVETESIRGVYWVLSVSESWGVEGGRLELEISNVDEVEVGGEGIIVGAIDSVQVQGIAIKPFPFVNSYVYRREMAASGFDADVPVDISNAVLDLFRVLVRFTTRPFRSNVVGSASGGGSTATSASGGGTTATSVSGGEHRHRMFATAEATSFPPANYRQYAAASEYAGGVPALLWLDAATSTDIYTDTADGDHSHDISIPNHTHEIVIPDHTHDLDYGIYDDIEYPDTIRCYINGVDKTSELGGPWGVGGGAESQQIEISDLLKASGLQFNHDVTFSCDSGQGEIEVTVELYGVMQTIRVT